ncbi:hypothetical protein FBBAL38_02310 [Flavobacteria bacterium BAL38]|nr:hypothetical protein FBBAL38_02310 [Flavobacteria bacterium BAL38]
MNQKINKKFQTPILKQSWNLELFFFKIGY